MNTTPTPPSKKKQSKKQAKQKATTDEEAPKQIQIRYSSIVRDGPSIPTIVGPIDGWKACVENLPNHPTMVSFCFCFAFHLTLLLGFFWQAPHREEYNHHKHFVSLLPKNTLWYRGKLLAFLP